MDGLFNVPLTFCTFEYLLLSWMMSPPVWKNHLWDLGLSMLCTSGDRHMTGDRICLLTPEREELVLQNMWKDRPRANTAQGTGYEFAHLR